MRTANHLPNASGNQEDRAVVADMLRQTETAGAGSRAAFPDDVRSRLRTLGWSAGWTAAALAAAWTLIAAQPAPGADAVAGRTCDGTLTGPRTSNAGTSAVAPDAPPAAAAHRTPQTYTHPTSPLPPPFQDAACRGAAEEVSS
jgi:hypothetical protein